jgi:hypothetical protein
MGRLNNLFFDGSLGSTATPRRGSGLIVKAPASLPQAQECKRFVCRRHWVGEKS